jgi:hypothetical protein
MYCKTVRRCSLFAFTLKHWQYTAERIYMLDAHGWIILKHYLLNVMTRDTSKNSSSLGHDAQTISLSCVKRFRFDLVTFIPGLYVYCFIVPSWMTHFKMQFQFNKVYSNKKCVYNNFFLLQKTTENWYGISLVSRERITVRLLLIFTCYVVPGEVLQ